MVEALPCSERVRRSGPFNPRPPAASYRINPVLRSIMPVLPRRHFGQRSHARPTLQAPPVATATRSGRTRCHGVRRPARARSANKQKIPGRTYPCRYLMLRRLFLPLRPLNPMKQSTCHILCNDRNQQFARTITREHCRWLAEIAARTLMPSHFHDTGNCPRLNALISRS